MVQGPGARAVFLDRDGVINEVVFRHGKPASPRTMEEFRFVEGIAAALQRLVHMSFRLFVISNQPDIARGFLAPAVLDAMTERIMTCLPIERVLTCTHDDRDGCACRKPRAGMLHTLASSEGLDLSRSFIVGDSWKDVQAGTTAGCTTILLRRDYNEGVTADYRLANMMEAANLISGGSQHGASDGILRHYLSR